MPQLVQIRGAPGLHGAKADTVGARDGGCGRRRRKAQAARGTRGQEEVDQGKGIRIELRGNEANLWRARQEHRLTQRK